MIPAIVVSTHAAGLGVIRALGIHRVPIVAVHYDDGDVGHLSKYVTERLRAPHPEKYEGEFLDFLLGRCARWGGGLLIPCSDAALATISRHKSDLQRHYIVACPEWEITQLFLDKKNTYPLARAAGVPAPKTIVLRSRNDLEEYRHALDYPCLVKPSSSHQYHHRFQQKMVRVESFDQTVAAFEQAAACGLEMMLQELIPGEDANGVNYNSYFWDGAPLVEFTAQKVRNAPPALGSPCVVVSRQIPEVLESGRRILQAMGFFGYSCTEFKKDPRDQVYKLMEVNGRHNLSSLLAVRCGINFPWLQYEHLVEGRRPSGAAFRADFYWVDLLRDCGNSIPYFRKEDYSLQEYLRPYLRPHCFAILDPRDPRPFLSRCFYLVRKGMRAVAEQLVAFASAVGPRRQQPPRLAPEHRWPVEAAGNPGAEEDLSRCALVRGERSP